MRILSWNVNGIRAWIKKIESRYGGLAQFLKAHQVAIACFQETKVSSLADVSLNHSASQLLSIEGYESFWSFSRRKKGWSGVVTYALAGCTRNAWEAQLDMDATRIEHDMLQLSDNEGRIIATDHEKFWLFNVYFPNAGTGDVRFRYKMAFYEAFQKHIQRLTTSSSNIPPLIVCGDINTAHKLIDIWNPQKFQSHTGFLPIERHWIDTMVEHEASPFLDTFRYYHPNVTGKFTYWDVIRNARSRNEGWRIDVFWLQRSFQSAMLSADIWSDIMGSDHCPIVLDLDNQLAQPSMKHDTTALSAAFHSPAMVATLASSTEKRQPSISSYFSKKRSIHGDDMADLSHNESANVLDTMTAATTVGHYKHHKS
jgi:exodeoxyribonuclease III